MSDDNEQKLGQFALSLLQIFHKLLAVTLNLALEHDRLKLVICQNPHLGEKWAQQARRIQDVPEVAELHNILGKMSKLIRAVEDGSWLTSDPDQLMNEKPN